MFVLDTNVISELRRPERSDRAVLSWAESLPVECFFVSAITILELEQGALTVAREDKAFGSILRDWIDRVVLPHFGGRVLSIDRAVAMRCAELHVPTRRAERDAFIAATALVHGMKIATRNVRDFQPMGVAVINPWEPSD
ncbi:type II toxin-antitoxin system VapC family toxin [Prosthecomicrobium pneumaticum]|uniref:Ribonuclease VapC n=1 Tax=Prosthecomicrobium pneumaticum TaxID=81895 RepID=A0A7W9L340_9HYPH|nr:type II toxin-antitoxin system VapC family toxin [Prosthecomicrobium pneumaticum]MBB5754147.1 hypothetical protein [Prosthecomicrobium pneumaticum]